MLPQKKNPNYNEIALRTAELVSILAKAQTQTQNCKDLTLIFQTLLGKKTAVLWRSGKKKTTHVVKLQNYYYLIFKIAF